MNQEIRIHLPIEPHEVPAYPTLFERCNFCTGLRDEKGELIAFGYVAGMGLQHVGLVFVQEAYGDAAIEQAGSDLTHSTGS